MTVKEFYKVVSERCRVDIDLFEDDYSVPLCDETGDAELLFVRSWNVFHEYSAIENTNLITERFTLHFDLEVKQCRQISQ